MLATPVIRDLQLHRHGLELVRPDPTYVYLSPDGTSLAIWRDPRKTPEEIRRFSPPDATTYLEYARMLDAFYGISAPLMLMHPTRPDARD
ncbi:MAG: dehydrogenase, partial [Actinobacteria bacterium]|nr:dehydrogenase [Actinomycetota bacterium]